MTQNYIERYWRDAKPEDAIKDPPMACRMRFDESEDWYDAGHLMGCDRSSDEKWITNEWQDRQCQVYDAPDPGEGYELIDIDKDIKQDGDEVCRPNGVWKRAASPEFFSSHVYRRRITPVVTYVPFTWEDREQLRGRWIGSNDGRCQRSINTMHNDNGSFYLCAISAESLCTDWHFIDTGEPVGKKVAQ